MVTGKHVADTTWAHLFDMQRNNGLKFSRDRKNYIDFQLDALGGGGWGYFENVQWTLCVKESICVRPLTSADQSIITLKWKTIVQGHNVADSFSSSQS